MASLRLNPLLLEILLTLVDEPLHGYAILQRVADAADRSSVLGPSSLYYSLDRLERAELITEVPPPADAAQDPHGEQRRYFGITPKGRVRLRDELSSLERLVAQGHRLRLSEEA